MFVQKDKITGQKIFSSAGSVESKEGMKKENVIQRWNE